MAYGAIYVDFCFTKLLSFVITLPSITVSFFIPPTSHLRGIFLSQYKKSEKIIKAVCVFFCSSFRNNVGKFDESHMANVILLVTACDFVKEIRIN